MYIRTICLAVFLASFNGLSAQNSDLDTLTRQIELGEVTVVTVSGSETLTPDSPSVFFSSDAASVASVISGIHLINFGARGEASLSIRGFDIRNVPVFIDGIPVYMPYDGYLDLGRITLTGSSQLSVSKGFTAIGFGTGTLGGAINIVNRRPKEKFEFLASAGYGSGNREKTSFGIGSNFGKFYISGNFSSEKQDFYPLSAKFDTTNLPGTERGNERDNSWFNDLNLSVKAGFTPNASDEYSFNYIYQHSEKGIPPYSGRDTRQQERYWQWPEWHKNSLYFIAKKRTGDRSFLTLRTYYDDFGNTLDSFDDNTYTSQTRRYAFTSIYKDYSLGSNFEFTISPVPAYTLKFSGQVKNDHHAEYNLGEAQRNFSDLTGTTGFESGYRFSNKLKLIGSFAFAARKGLVADDYNSIDSTISPMSVSKSPGITAQIAGHFSPAEGHLIVIGAYKKDRFATMKERYSYRAGTGLPNPELKSEKANELEVTYNGSFGDYLKINSAIFYTDLKDAIVAVYDTSSMLTQAKNTGRALSYGIELGADLQMGSFASLQASYTFIKMKNITEPDLFFVHIPENELSFTLQILPFKKIGGSVNMRYMSDRYSTSYGTTAGSFYTLNLQCIYRINRMLQLKAGIENLLDQSYELAEGFPAAGRTFFGSLQVRI